MTDYAIAELDRRLAAMQRVGTIEAVDYGDPNATPPQAPRCRVRVSSEDGADDWISGWLPWRSQSAGKVRHWNPPAAGEQAMIKSPSGEVAGGFVEAGFYTDAHGQAPDNRPNVVVWDMGDGCRIEYDADASSLLAKGMKTAIIQATGDITAQTDGNVSVQAKGTLDLQAASININATSGDVTINGQTVRLG
jgi:phage baseplate assembly protein V